MKYIITLFLIILSSTIIAQCEAITINTLHLERYPDCKYVLKLNTTLTHGNPSIQVTYSCGTINHELPCFNWPNPSNRIFASDTFVCDCNMIVRVRVVGHASRNCNGNSCIELGLTNLELKPKKDNTTNTGNPSWYISDNRLVTNFDEYTTSIYSVSGNLLFSSTSNNIVTYLPKLTSGVYILIMQTYNKKIIKKIVLHN